jgi:hypothetical protein
MLRCASFNIKQKRGDSTLIVGVRFILLLAVWCCCVEEERASFSF